MPGSENIVVRDRREFTDFDIDILIVDHWLPIIGLQGLALYNLYVRMGSRRDDVAFPGYSLIRRHLGIGRSTISRYNRLLECCGLIRIEPGTRTQPNYYYILDVPEVTADTLVRVKDAAAQLSDAKFVETVQKRIEDWEPIEAHYSRRAKDETVVVLNTSMEEGSPPAEHLTNLGSPPAEHPANPGSPPAEHLTIEGSPVAGKGVPPQDWNMHACMPNNNNHPPHTPPMRQPRGLSVPVLKNQYPTQPRDMSPDEAFNLALDKALAHLPVRLRKCAGAPLYTLAAELHPVAIENPSSRWPDAGGAGWVVDAVSDADSSGVEIGSVQYIRAIVSRWLAEGNPYAVPLGQPSESTGETTDRDIHAPLDDILPLYWKGATGQDLTDEGRGLLIGLLGPKPDGVVESELLQIIAAVGREYRDVVAVTPELVGKAVRGGALPAIGPEAVPAPPVRTGAPAVAMARSKPDAAEPDPVLAQVTDWYLRDVGNIAPLLADDIRDLTQEQRDLTVWEFAFFETRAMPNPKSRWNFITAITHNPDWNKINAWLAAGKKEPTRERKRTRRTSGGHRQKQRGLPPVRGVDEIPDPPVPDEVLPPLN